MHPLKKATEKTYIARFSQSCFALDQLYIELRKKTLIINNQQWFAFTYIPSQANSSQGSNVDNFLADLHNHRDVTPGATCGTVVAPKFSNTLTLFQPRGADSAPTWQRLHQNIPSSYISESFLNLFKSLELYLYLQLLKLFENGANEMTKGQLISNSNFLKLHCPKKEQQTFRNGNYVNLLKLALKIL